MEMLRMLSDDWFLREPAFFALYCQQELEENVRMECAVRCGQGKIQYNPLVLKHKNYAELEQLMRIELIRLFLKHPYEREPEGCSRESMAIGSNVTIADDYCTLHKEKLPLHEPGYYHLPMGMYYEWYAKHIEQEKDKDEDNRQKNPSDSPDNESQVASSKDHSQQESSSNQQPKEGDNSYKDSADLWREDSLQRQKIDELIERTTDWGSIPADVVEKIKASTKARINSHLIWNGFRSAVLSSQRQFTRMRPNRRTGFKQMGNTRQYDTRLLVGIDVSGSITTEALQNFFSAVNRLFRYGTTQVDVCQFDAALGNIEPMKHAHSEVKVHGRGGTNFQPIIDYTAEHQDYDGLIILTDGQAPAPILPPHFRTRILWVCQDRQAYECYHEWMEKSGRCTYL